MTRSRLVHEDVIAKVAKLSRRVSAREKTGQPCQDHDFSTVRVKTECSLQRNCSKQLAWMNRDKRVNNVSGEWSAHHCVCETRPLRGAARQVVNDCRTACILLIAHYLDFPQKRTWIASAIDGTTRTTIHSSISPRGCIPADVPVCVLVGRVVTTSKCTDVCQTLKILFTIPGDFQRIHLDSPPRVVSSDLRTSTPGCYAICADGAKPWAAYGESELGGKISKIALCLDWVTRFRNEWAL